MPVPVTMIGLVVRLIPSRIFEEMRSHVEDPYRGLMTKETVSMILEHSVDILKENKGLEIVHIEGPDGTFVSIKL